MKRMNKLLALFLALAMLLSVSAVVFAASTGTLSIVKYSNDAAGQLSTAAYVGESIPTLEEQLAAYAIEGIEFTYLKIADFNYNDSTGELLYSVSAGIGAPFSGMTGSVTAQALYDALAQKLAEAGGKTAVKNLVNGVSTKITTGTNGVASASNLALGMYLVVETGTNNDISETFDPFLVSIPQPKEDGAFIYNVTVYPKNGEDTPDLSKTVSDSGAVGTYDHTTDVSIGDKVYYKIESNLPVVEKDDSLTYLGKYEFVDTRVAGLTFNNDVVIKVNGNTWDSSYYTVTKTSSTVTTITVTAAGLANINTVNNGGVLMEISYSCTLNSNAVLGNDGNDNDVVLSWNRNGYTDETLKDCCHVYTYGIELTKSFSGGEGDYSKVKFTVQNGEGKYINAAETAVGSGIYVVNGVSDTAIEFTPSSTTHAIVLKGLEADTYSIVETATDENYSKLTSAIEVEITAAEGTETCPDCNQKFLVASATVNNAAVTMKADGASINAIAPLNVVNTGIILPPTGSTGTWMISVFGILMMAAAAFVIVMVCRKKKETNA